MGGGEVALADGLCFVALLRSISGTKPEVLWFQQRNHLV